MDSQPSPHPQTSFPVITIIVIGIILTATFLLSYYIFVIKCCLNLHNSDIIQRLSRRSRRPRPWPYHHHDPPSHHHSRGLHESAIQAIPILKFKAESSFHECSVCLYEFEEEERIRMLPNCFHVFHIDCIDTWLQTHLNCPLCRADIVTSTAPILNSDVVIDVREEHSHDCKGLSLGDECIDFRVNDDHDEFAVKPVRRSFSMGSLSERRLYATVQEILRQNPHFKGKFEGEGSNSMSV